MFSDWSIIDANLIISGTITIKNEKLSVKIKLWDVYSEKLLLSKKIDGLRKKSWRTLAHIISNLVYQRVTGEKGYFDTKIVYVSESMSSNKTIKKLAIMDYDGNAHQFLTDGTDLVLTPRFSPNGKSVAYLSFSKRKPTVYLLDLSNKKKKILGNFSGMSFAPRFSPDGKNIIFSLTNKGSSNIFSLEISASLFCSAAQLFSPTLAGLLPAPCAQVPKFGRFPGFFSVYIGVTPPSIVMFLPVI